MDDAPTPSTSKKAILTGARVSTTRLVNAIRKPSKRKSGLNQELTENEISRMQRLGLLKPTAIMRRKEPINVLLQTHKDHHYERQSPMDFGCVVVISITITAILCTMGYFILSPYHLEVV